MDCTTSPRIQTASVRLRRKRDDAASIVSCNRKSFDHKFKSQEFEDDDCHNNTLDHSTDMSDVKNNIRQALRSKYRFDEPVTIKHFGYIDHPNNEVLLKLTV